MITYPNSVIVANSTAAAAPTRGYTQLLGQTGQVLLPSQIATYTGNVVYIGVQTGNNTKTWDSEGNVQINANGQYLSAPIDLKRVVSVYASAYQSPVLEVAIIDASATTFQPENGVEYCLRLVYKDVPGFPGQMTQTYRVYTGPANTTTTGATPTGNMTKAQVLDALCKQINKNKWSRVVAVPSTSATVPLAQTPAADFGTATSGTVAIFLIAKDVDDNNGIESINEFSMVNFEAVFYRAARTNDPVIGVKVEVPQAGASLDNWNTLTGTPSTTPVPTPESNLGYNGPQPGFGYWKVVRDREKWALGYKGITNPVHWPVIKPAPFVEMGYRYAGFVIESMVEYQSPNNSYKELTKLITEYYFPAYDSTGTPTTTGSWLNVVNGLSALFTKFNVQVKAYAQGKPNANLPMKDLATALAGQGGVQATADSTSTSTTTTGA